MLTDTASAPSVVEGFPPSAAVRDPASFASANGALLSKGDDLDQMFETFPGITRFDSTWDALIPLEDGTQQAIAIEPMDEPSSDSGDDISAFTQEIIEAPAVVATCNSPKEVMAAIATTPAPKRPRAKGGGGTKTKSPVAHKKIATAVVAVESEPAAEGTEAEPAVPTVEEDDDKDGEDVAEAKRQRRMQRNRESAAESRKRKKQKVEELEVLIASLRETVESLQEQNAALRLECERVTGGSCAVPTPAPPVADSAVSV